MEVKKDRQPPAQTKTLKPKNHFIWLGSYLAIACICLVLYLSLRFDIFRLPGTYQQLTKKISLAIFLAVVILSVSKFIEIIILNRSGSKYSRYNLTRITHLLSILIVVIVFISFLFANWYAAAVSLGLISLLTGFALQTPISSFIAWIYIIIRNPYRIGDRIQIDNFRGDVIEIGYLDTTLWEFAGEYLTNDLPSGRLIRFPNSLILQSAVFNYSWRNFQYIWNEIPFHVAYESDLNYVEQTIKQVTFNELGPEMQDHLKELKVMVRDSPVDSMEIKEYPFVSFRINANTWVEVTVTYLVPPKKAATIRSNIIRNILTELVKQPGKALFPNGNSR